MSTATEVAGFQPWLGLLPYSEDDQELFFGRDRDTQDLLRLVRREVLTVLFGRSGTGKSSLLKAGLFPKLRQEQLLPIWIRLDHSGRTAYGEQVRAEIATAVAAHGIEVEVLNEPLADETEDFWEYLHRVVFWDAKNQPVTPVLVFDQFEEIFTLGRNRPEIGALLDELASVVENLIPKRVRDRVVSGDTKLPVAYNERHYKLIISLREDYVSRLDSLSTDMPSVMHNRHALTHMSGEQALEVVLKPGGDLVSEVVGRKIVRFVAAANEVEAIVGPDGDEPANVDFPHLRTEPALLSLVCSELNLQRIKEGRTEITLEQVQRSSDQILEDFYERSLEGLDLADRAFIEDRLVTTSGFRTTVPVEEANLADLSDEEIEILVARRLLRKEDRLGTPHIELTHDVLTRVVTRSRSLRQERQEQEIKRRKEEKLNYERRKMRDQAEIEKHRLRRMRNFIRAIWAVIALSTIFATVAVILLFSRSEVEKARRLADARALALNGIDVGPKDPELALLLSIESAMVAFEDKQSTRDSGMATREIEMALRTATRESLIRRRYEGHTSKVYSVDFDREGRRLITGSWHPDATARIWDVNGGKEIARLEHGTMPGGNTTVSCARFSPNGRRIVTTTYRNDGSVYIWDAESLSGTGNGGPRVFNRPLVTFNGHKSWVTCAAFSPDGKRVASGGYDNLVRIWDPETGGETRIPLGNGAVSHSKRIRSVCFNAEGTRLLSSSDDGNAILWDLTDTAEHRIFNPYQGKRETLHDADLSPSGALVATAGNDKTVRVWDVATGLQLASQDHPDAPMDVAFIDETHLVTVCNDSAIRFWVLTSAAAAPIHSHHPDASAVKVLRLLATQRGHRGWIRSAAVSPDRRFIATGGDDTSARLWKLPPGGETAVLEEPNHSFWAADAFLSKSPAGDRLLAFTGTENGEIHALDAFTERTLENWGPLAGDVIRHAGQVRSISVNHDGSKLVTSSNDQTAIVWNARTGRPEFQITGHQGEGGGTVYQARFSSDGKRIVTASNDGSARVWDAATGAPGPILIQDRQEIGSDGFEDAGALLARLSNASDPVSSFLLGRFTGEERARLIQTRADSGGHRELLATVLSRIIREDSLKDETAFGTLVLRPMTRELMRRESGGINPKILNRLILEDAFTAELKRDRIYDARFSGDGSRIVTADFDARTATIWDASDGRKLNSLTSSPDPKSGHSDSVTGASFSPDGKRVVTACVDGFCRVWNVDSGRLEATIPHGIAVRTAEYSPDGKLILSASADGIARIWTLPDYRLRADLKGHTDTLTDARFDKEGNYIVTSSRDGTARIYQTHPWWVYSLATQRVTRKLTHGEREQFRITRKPTAEEQDYYQKTEIPENR